MTKDKCGFPGCGKPVRTRGFCVACYYRLLRNGTLERGATPQRWKHRLSAIDPDKKTAVCLECGPVTVVRRENCGWRCSAEANRRSRLYKAAYRASRKAMLGPACEVCGTTDRLNWDHDHKTGEFRGTLCSQCNTAIGLVAESVERLKSAIRYLERKRQS